MAVWYCRDNGTIGWSGVTAWSNKTAAAGELIRQATTPTVGNERVFVCIIGGATGSTEPTWVVTKGAKNVSSSATYQECTGQPAVNGDITNTPASSTMRSAGPGLGKIIKDNAATHIFICSTAGTCGAGEPTYNTAAVGNTTADGSVTWTYIGTSFSAWAAPHAKWKNAHTTNWATSGDTVYLADDHSETQAATNSILMVGGQTTMVYNYSVDHTVSLPPTTSDLLAGATITTTGNNSIIVGGGCGYIEGVTFSAGSGAVNATLTIGNTSAQAVSLANCALHKAGTTGTSTAITLGAGTATLIKMVNTTMQFGATGDSVSLSAGQLEWKSTASAIAGATFPTTLFTPPTASAGTKLLDGVDLSALGSGVTLVGTGFSSSNYFFLNCKTGASVTVATAPTSVSGPLTDLISSDSSGTIYRQERHAYAGTLTPETTIVRTGGATDGTTPLAWKIVTTANSSWLLPFECFPIDIWNDTTGSSVTATIYGIWGVGAVPNSDDIGIRVKYHGASGSPLASTVTSTKANNLATGSALSSDSSTWGGSTTKFAMAVTFTPQLKGYIRIAVEAYKVSSTFYIDPRPVLS